MCGAENDHFLYVATTAHNTVYSAAAPTRDTSKVIAISGFQAAILDST